MVDLAISPAGRVFLQAGPGSGDAAAAGVGPRTTKAFAPRRPRSKTVTAAELIARGVARHMIQSWITSGMLLRTEQRGVYRTTAQTEARIAACTARGAGR